MEKCPFVIVGGANLSRKSRMVQRAEAVLAKLPPNTLIDSRELAARLDVNHLSLREHSADIDTKLWTLRQRKKLYGNPKTIAAFRKWAKI